MFVLSKGMHHSPSLLSKFSDFIKNGHTLIGLYELSEYAHSDEGSCASHSCTAVYNWHGSLYNTVEELIDDEMNVFLTLLIGYLSIRPICYLIVCDDFSLGGECVFKL